MKIDEGKILFKEIKTYEEACYYNSNLENRVKYNIRDPKVKKKEMKDGNKESKVGETLLGILGDVFEFALDVVISILD